MRMYDLKNELTQAVVLKSQSVTATANGSAVNLAGYAGGVLVVFNVAAATAGTNPTFDAKLQTSADGSTNWTDISGAAITQVTTTDSIQTIGVDPRAISQYIRVVVTIGGTSSPAFPAGAVLMAQKQYK